MIRLANHDDIPAMVNLVQSFFCNGELDGTGLTLDTLTIEFFARDLIDLDEAVIFVADVDGEVVGAIAGNISPWAFNAEILVLNEIGWYVPKEYRRKYARQGSELKNAFYQWGRDMGATTLAMKSTAREESPRVVEFYEKSGLRLIDTTWAGIL